MNSACPGCGAVYNVTSKDVGRRLKCKKCNAPVIITEQGIEPDSAPVTAAPVAAGYAPQEGEDIIPSKPRRLRGGFSDTYQQNASLLASLLFGIGAFLVIFEMFMPLIGLAKIEARKEMREQAIRDFNKAKKEIEEGKDDGNKTNRIAELQKEHKKDLDYWDEKIQDAKSASMTSLYFEQYFMLFGFLLVMVASIMFMSPEQPTTKRVVGAVVITFQMLVVFTYFLGASLGASMAAVIRSGSVR